MSALAAPAPPERAPDVMAPEGVAWRASDRIGLGLAWALGLLFCAITGAIIVFMAVQGLRYLTPSLLTTNPVVGASQSQSGGFLGPLIGTGIVAGMGIAVAGPVGTAVAVWLTEYGRPIWLARVAESAVEMLAGAPSIVLALFGLLVFESKALGFMSQTNGGIVFGKSFLVGSVIIALVGLPYVVSSVREGLRGIPDHVREASYALGKSKATTIRRILLPSIRPSVITGYMLGVGHMIGDTAIILLLVGDTQVLQGVGNVPVLGYLRGTGSTLTSYIFDNAPTGDLNNPNKAYAAAFVLMVIILALNAFVDVFGRRSRRKRWG